MSAVLLGDSFLCGPPRSLALPAGFQFQHGQTIAPFTIVYETFGTLAPAKDNAILLCHALSPSAHAAGKYTPDDPKPGWWDGMIGYGPTKGIDLERYFVVCVNFPGSPWGTTAPRSIDPATDRPWGSRYPWPTIDDMVEAERIVADHLGIARFRAIVGNSLGGMQALAWAARHPERFDALVCIAASAAVPVASVAWHLIGRKLIESDPQFAGGDYYGATDLPNGSLRGLQLARMVGHMTYLSEAALEAKFGRRRRGGTRQFEIDSYLDYQGQKFAGAYDANSYIRIQAAMDEMDLEEQHGSLAAAFARFRGAALLMSFDTDWLFPPIEIAKVHGALREAGVASELVEVETPNGHDAFLLDYPLVNPPVREFLSRIAP